MKHNSFVKHNDGRVLAEEWKSIIDYPNFEISSLGNIRSLSRGKNKKFDINHAGYNRVGLWSGGKRKMKRVARLVAINFIPNPLNLKEVNHKNGIKTDDRAINLEWCDRKFNINHAIETGLKKPSFGETNGSSRFTENDIIEMRRLRNSGLSLSKIGSKFNAGKTTISRIVNNKAWTHI